MSYQEDCENYALYGNPMRDHYDHEENARFDRYDGMREQFYDSADVDEDRNWFNSLTDQQKEAVKNQNKQIDVEIDNDDVPF